MTPERWQQVKELFTAALDRDAAERPSFLARACAGDEALRKEVEDLLRNDEQTFKLIDGSVTGLAAELLAQSKSPSILGRTIGPYRIEKEVGRGGMGEVYLARDTRLDRPVAIKLLPDSFTHDADRVRRFHQEIRATSLLNHPNIVTIHEVTESQHLRFIVSEFVEGKTLREMMSTEGIRLDRAIDIVIQTASALAAAHEAGVVHRDIKPENIMVRPDGYVKVVDFGLAKLTGQPQERSAEASDLSTKTGVVMGTIKYMSPEQARGQKVDHRTDIFSLGVVLYEAIAGRAPFDGETPSHTIVAILEREPRPLASYSNEIPQALEAIAIRALTKDRDGRYQTAQEFLADLKSLKQRLEFETGLERSGTGEARARPAAGLEAFISFIKRRRKGVALVLAAVMVAAVASFFIRRTPALTERDTILLADFVNTTGDAVFDGTLKQALAVQLEQTPFLNIYSEQQIRDALRYMARSPDDRVTKDVAREICQRQGIKAMLSGSISNLGTDYVISLEAVNARTGDVIARQQVEAGSKEQVLSSLGMAATKLREKLGESLASIQKFDTPIEQATTSSLDALKAFSLAREQIYGFKQSEAISSLKQAVALDPNFGIAYSVLGVAYGNLGQRDLASEFARRAFDLRNRASERERLYIISNYYYFTTGELDKCIEALEQLTRTYPRYYGAHSNLGLRYVQAGQYENAIEQAREAIRINPTAVNPYPIMGAAFFMLNRVDEAKELYSQATAINANQDLTRYGLYVIAFVQGDTAAMQQQVDWSSARPGEFAHLTWQAETATYQGRLRKAKELYESAVGIMARRNLKQLAANSLTGSAIPDALVGNCEQAKHVSTGLAIERSGDALFNAAFVSALCGNLNQAQSLADEYAKNYPKDTLVNSIRLPLIRAAIELRRGNPAQAVRLLEPAAAYGGAGGSWPEYVRGLAYLEQRAGAEAAAEFQKILDRRGWGVWPNFFLGPLAHLGLARAVALTGDAAKSREAYQDFFALWKDADPGTPILIEARKEYERLKR